MLLDELIFMLNSGGVWEGGGGKKSKKTDGRDTLLQKQVNAGTSLAGQALCEACTAS